MTDAEILSLYHQMTDDGARAWLAFGSGVARRAPAIQRPPLLRLAHPALLAVKNELHGSIEPSSDLRTSKAVGSK